MKTKIPQLHVNIFGFPSKPSNLPSWYSYYQQPNKKLHNEIYNTSAIYVGASYSEGFCLTPPEAMMCGCAVACTDIGGYKTVGIDGITALLSPVGDFPCMKQHSNQIFIFLRNINISSKILKVKSVRNQGSSGTI